MSLVEPPKVSSVGCSVSGLMTGGPFPIGDVICFEVAYDDLVQSSVSACAAPVATSPMSRAADLPSSARTFQFMTVVTTASAYDQPIADIAVHVPAGGEAMAGPFDPGEVANTGTGLGTVTYDDATVLTIAAVTTS